MIEIKKVHKKYDKIEALKGISFKINSGELFGILGPNGAGKTTLINIINTLLPFDAGKVLINGLNLKQHTAKIKRIIGVVPQEISLYEDLTALENLRFWGTIYNIKKKDLKERCDEILRMVGLYSRRKDAIKHFSGGMKRRINIAAGLLHNPQIILMDEPTVGVDPQSRNFIFELIMQLKELGRTIIYTTHYMEEAEKLCDRIAIIDKGKLIALDTKKELYKMLGNKNKLIIKFKDEINIPELKKILKDYNITSSDNYTIQITEKNIIDKMENILNILRSLELELEELDYLKPTIEDLFLQLTGRELRE